MGKLTPDQERDKEVTDAIVGVIGGIRGALKGFEHLCEAGADYLEAKNRERYFDGRRPMAKKPVTRLQPEKLKPRSKG